MPVIGDAITIQTTAASFSAPGTITFISVINDGVNPVYIRFGGGLAQTNHLPIRGGENFTAQHCFEDRFSLIAQTGTSACRIVVCWQPFEGEGA